MAGPKPVTQKSVEEAFEPVQKPTDQVEDYKFNNFKRNLQAIFHEKEQALQKEGMKDKVEVTEEKNNEVEEWDTDKENTMGVLNIQLGGNNPFFAPQQMDSEKSGRVATVDSPCKNRRAVARPPVAPQRCGGGFSMGQGI